MNHNHWLKLWQSKDNGLIQIELIECNRRKKDVIWTMNCTQIKNSSLEPQNGKLAIKHFQVENKKWKIKNDYSKCHYYFHLKITEILVCWVSKDVEGQMFSMSDQHLASPGIKLLS